MNKSQQTHFLDNRLPLGVEHVTIKELAGAMCYSPLTVQRAFDEGKVRGFELNGRAASDQEQRRHPRIPREMAILAMLNASNGLDDESVIEQLCQVFDRIPARIQAICYSELARRLKGGRS